MSGRNCTARFRRVSISVSACATASNHGFTHRQVTSLLLDSTGVNTIYAGLINDKEFGGVFVSRDSGQNWQQMSAGLDGRDVFSLRQTESGALIAGTNRGVFEWKTNSYRWEPINTVIDKKEIRVSVATKRHPAVRRTVVSHSEFGTRINDLAVNASMTGTGGMAKAGAGNLTLNQQNFATGNVSIGQGTVTLARTDVGAHHGDERATEPEHKRDQEVLEA